MVGFAPQKGFSGMLVYSGTYCGEMLSGRIYKHFSAQLLSEINALT